MRELVAWRAGLLGGRRVVVAGLPDPIRERLEALGAEVHPLPAGDEEGVEAWARDRARVDAVVVDARSEFAARGLRAASDAAWSAVRSVVVGAMLGNEGAAKVVLIGPASGAAEYAGALRAALENLARTLSTEWARYGITTAAVLPGAASTEDEVAELVTLLVSPAGEYFSGCRFELV